MLPKWKNPYEWRLATILSKIEVLDIWNEYSPSDKPLRMTLGHRFIKKVVFDIET